MRGKILFSAALAAVIAVLAFAPQPAEAHGDVVSMREVYLPGTIVIITHERALYLVLGPGTAIRYPVGVGRLGMQWAGTAYIDGKYIKPAWSPPDSIRKDYRTLPPVVPGGSPQNPMGVAAMTLSGAANTPSTAPTMRARSAVLCRTAASACTMPISKTCTAASCSARGWW